MKIPKITTLEKHQETVNLDRKSKKSNRTLQVHPINLPISKFSLWGTEHRKMASFWNILKRLHIKTYTHFT